MTKALFFIAENGTLGYEPYITNGDATDATIISNIYPGSGDSMEYDSDYYYPVYFDGKVLFGADNETNGYELWSYDPKTGEAMRLEDHYLGSGDGDPYSMTVAGDYVYYAAYDGSDYYLWKTDGTVGGAEKVKQVEVDNGGTYYEYGMVAFGESVLFYSEENAANGGELWISDGTELGTKVVKDIYAGPNDGFYGLDHGGVMGDTYYFAAQNGTDGYELWKTDGTDGGTMMVKDIYAGPNSGTPKDFYAHNGVMYFSADDGTNGRELWRTDGTSGGTQMVKNIYEGSSGGSPNASAPYDFMSLGDKMIFSAEDSDGRELWITDGTGSGTVQLADIRAGSSDGLDRNDYYPHTYFAKVGDGDKVVFMADQSGTGEELWVTDGTDIGTKLLVDIYPGSSDSSPRYFISDGEGRAYFQADTDDEGEELWVTDGTAEGTYLVKNIYPDDSDGDAYPGVIVDINGEPGMPMLDSVMVHEDADIDDTVGMLTADDPDNDVLTYTLKDDADGYFGIMGDKVVVKKALDYETKTSYDIVVEVEDPHGVKAEKMYTIEVKDVNEAPEMLMLGGTKMVAEDAAIGTVVGDLSAMDPEGGSVSYMLSDDAGGLFGVEDGKVVLEGMLDYEDMTSHDIEITATDADGNESTMAYTIEVMDVNENEGTSGPNTWTGTSGADTYDGLGGADVMKGRGGSDDLSGSGGRDVINGNGGRDTIDGGNGRDDLNGGNGRDLIIGGRGRDEMTGGRGGDTFEFTASAKQGKDTITDFDLDRDMIDLSGQGLSFTDLTIRVGGGDARIVTDGGEWIKLEGIAKADVTSDIFDFG